MKQFVSQEFPCPDGTLKVSGRGFHYIAEVRREKEGSVIHVRLPDGVFCPFRIERVDRASKALFLVSAGQAQVDELAQLPRLILFQWILKSHAMDLVVRQAAEVGVSVLVPVAGMRCVPRARLGERVDRWQRIVKEAMQQSGSGIKTEVAEVISADAVPKALEKAGGTSGFLLIMLDELLGSGKTVHECVCALKDASGFCQVALAVGPEGGMTAEERELLAVYGFQGVHFNTNILRAETAALYGLAAVQSAIMEKEKWRLNA